MTSINERFAEFFTPERFIRLSQKTKMHDAQQEVLAFFRQELLALAEEVEANIAEPVGDFERGDNAGLKHAAALIKSRANELV